ncbi:MAG: polysaccharide biosynthesis C-terminal domain-containing protein, partial [Bacteroidetes bacterium]|nr:polysaccharide biosynthesis C-terminal domain-containing protein [Bacteroidota bacterium]
TSLSGSLTKILLTFLLVPMFGIMGAAYATLAGYIMVEVTLFIVVQRFYHIDYEYARILKLTLVTAAAFTTVSLLDPGIMVKGGILLAWGAGIIATGFFTRGERDTLLRLLKKST